MDRPDTYTLLDFISYLCEFGFINFVGLTFLCFNDAQKRFVSHRGQNHHADDGCNLEELSSVAILHKKEEKRRIEIERYKEREGQRDRYWMQQERESY